MRPRAYSVQVKRLLRTTAIIVCCAILLLAVGFVFIGSYGRIQQHQNADIICVFGAAVWGASPSPELEARVTWACRLYQEGRAPVIFLSGGPTGGTLTEPDVMANVALGLGVPRSALVLDTKGINTARTLDNLRQFMTNNGMTSCLMVSSPFHMARIMTLATLKGLHAVTCPPATSPVSVDFALQARAIAREELALIKDLAVLMFSP